MFSIPSNEITPSSTTVYLIAVFERFQARISLQMMIAAMNMAENDVRMFAEYERSMTKARWKHALSMPEACWKCLVTMKRVCCDTVVRLL